jgi:MoaA/NifB/PqqE/SkfB family radical SAM enzyme
MIDYDIKKDSYKFNKNKIDFFINIGFVITNKCNQKCTFCCDPPKQNENFSLKKAKEYLDELAKENLKKLCITGGEPLLNPNVFEIAKHAHKNKLNVTLSTNGFILNKEKLLKLKPYIDNIRFSILGLSKTHDKITCTKGSFEKIMENIKLARDLNVPVTIISTIFNQNISELIDMAKLCEKEGIEKLYVFSLMYKGRTKKTHEKEYVSAEEINKTIKQINKISQKEKWNLEIVLIDWDIEGQCVLLYSNGDLIGSPSYSDVGEAKFLGNLNSKSARQLWEEYPFKKEYLKYYKDH